MSITFAAAIGYMTFGVLSLIGVLSLLMVMLWTTAFLGRKLFNDLRRVYCLSVITYWLPRVEREGWRVFPKCRP